MQFMLSKDTHMLLGQYIIHMEAYGNYVGIILGLLIANDIMELLWNNLGIIENNLE